MTAPSIRICIIEDNAAFARSLQEVILCSEDMECAATYSSSEEAGAAFQKPDHPDIDVVLLDLKLPGKGGLSLVPLLRSSATNAAILVLTSNDDYRTVLEAIQLGVVGYVLKDTPLADLRRSIREVHEGGSIIDPQLSRHVLEAFRDEESGDGNPLSQRERQVLELMALGYVKKEVAEQLGISYSAVALYTANIYEKLQVPNIAAAVAAAIRKGLI